MKTALGSGLNWSLRKGIRDFDTRIVIRVLYLIDIMMTGEAYVYCNSGGIHRGIVFNGAAI